MRARAVVLALLVGFLFYAVTIGWRGALLVQDGRLLAVLLGCGVLVMPFVAGWAVWRELRFGLATERMAGLLAEAGALPVDDLPRRPSGRIDRAAADAAFAGARHEVEGAPQDWRSWYRLALAYDAAADRRRARSAARHAVRLFRTQQPPSPPSDEMSG